MAQVPPIGRRIIVCGASGSGKTTLAREVAKRFDLDVICIDEMRLLPHWQFASESEMRKRITSAMERGHGGWVADDTGGVNADLLFSSADTVIWLRLPRRICQWRVLRRGVGSAFRPAMVGAGNHTGPGTIIFTGIWLAKMTKRWRAIQREIAANIRSRQPGSPVVVLRSQREIDAFVRGMREE